MVSLDSTMDAPHRDPTAPAELEVAHTQVGHKMPVVPADLKVMAPKHFHLQPHFLGHPRSSQESPVTHCLPVGLQHNCWVAAWH